jgi:hypothetical protein
MRHYDRITPLIAKTVQDIAGISKTFKANLIAWLASASNAIGDFFAGAGHFSNNFTSARPASRRTSSKQCSQHQQPPVRH